MQKQNVLRVLAFAGLVTALSATNASALLFTINSGSQVTVTGISIDGLPLNIPNPTPAMLTGTLNIDTTTGSTSRRFNSQHAAGDTNISLPASTTVDPDGSTLLTLTNGRATFLGSRTGGANRSGGGVNYDVSGFIFQLTGGILSGTALGQPVNVNFASQRFDFTLPSGTAQVFNGNGGATNLLLPISGTANGMSGTTPFTVTISGNITATAAAVPEPSTMLMLGSALAGLVLFGRQRARGEVA